MRLRQTISQLLDEIFAIEHAMELFQRKGNRGELERASDGFNAILTHVDGLGEIIAEARGAERPAPDGVRDQAA